MTAITSKDIENFKLYLVENEKSEATLEKYIRDIILFKRWVGEKAVDKTTVLQYKLHLIKYYAISSVNSMLSAIN